MQDEAEETPAEETPVAPAAPVAPLRLQETEHAMERPAFLDSPGDAFALEADAVRAEMGALVADDSVPKSLALAILTLQHRLDGAIASMHTAFVREIDRLHHSVDQVRLACEVDALTHRQAAHATQMRDLRALNEQLQALSEAPPPRGRR